MSRHTFSLLPVFLLLLSFSFSFSACHVNPVTGKKDPFVMSESREKALGASYHPQVEASMGFYEDQKLEQFLTQKGEEMAKHSHRPNLKFKFKIVDSPVVNAFAVPGGYVYFTRGILAHFNNEAEFAGVLGHEIGHVTARHSAKQMRNNTFAQLGVIAGAIAFPQQFQQFGELAQQGVGLLLLRNSREAESESDVLGVNYSTAIGYDAHEMAGFFRTIRRLQEDSGQSIPTFLSTHPDPNNREAAVKQLATEFQKKLPADNFKVNRNSYLRMIDGIVYGEDPKQGFIENSVFYHPVLKFQFPIPRNWKTANTPQQFQMASPDGNAMAVLTLAAEPSLEQAAQSVLSKNNLTLVTNRKITVNGLPAIAMISQRQNELTVLTYLIQYDNKIYKFHGLSLPANFNTNQRTYEDIFNNFARLTDPDKLNRQPERVKIETVKSNLTLKQALTSFGMPASRHRELSVLNGMELSDRVPAGTLIKIVR